MFNQMFLKFARLVICPAALMLAAQTVDAAAYIQSVRITSIHARDIGFDIYIDSNQNPDGCSQSGIVRVTGSVPNRPDLVATALTAFSLGKSINAFVNGCDSDGVPFALTVFMHSN